jgi:hypothetical protein
MTRVGELHSRLEGMTPSADAATLGPAAWRGQAAEALLLNLIRIALLAGVALNYKNAAKMFGKIASNFTRPVAPAVRRTRASRAMFR